MHLFKRNQAIVSVVEGWAEVDPDSAAAGAAEA
jgi:hypothetical protein